MLRENLVGTVIDINGEEWLLTEFLGEGAERVVYAASPLTNLEDDSICIKFDKPARFLEMETLHCMLRVFEEGYPNHPLLMTPQQRLRQLGMEMLTRVENDHLILQVDLYVRMLDEAFRSLLSSHGEAFASDDSAYELLRKSIFRPWLDENLVHRYRGLLDDELIYEEKRERTECALTQITEYINRQNEAGEFSPLSRNIIVKLIGLHAENYMCRDELIDICLSEEVRSGVTPEVLREINYLIVLLHKYLELQPDPQGIRRSGRGVALSACEVLERLSESSKPADRLRVGRAQFWAGKFLLLRGNSKAAVSKFRAALEFLEEEVCSPCRRETLVNLARIHNQSWLQNPNWESSATGLSWAHLVRGRWRRFKGARYRR
ncbi:hypothetical protein [Streptomyces milbemycinicus]|uniref:hypothetical protein n=1 Tax=Streptomyces milbemycinicus TaxID=476552 RepID=UPI00340CD35F